MRNCVRNSYRQKDPELMLWYYSIGVKITRETKILNPESKWYSELNLFNGSPQHKILGESRGIQ